MLCLIKLTMHCKFKCSSELDIFTVLNSYEAISSSENVATCFDVNLIVIQFPVSSFPSRFDGSRHDS